MKDVMARWEEYRAFVSDVIPGMNMIGDFRRGQTWAQRYETTME